MSSLTKSLPENPTPSPVQSAQGPLVLTIRGLGPLFNFKNSKMRTRNGLITSPALKKRMDAITQSLLSQLRSHFQIESGATLTDAQLRCLTLSLPHDDCWTAVPKLEVSAELSDECEVGAVITITRLP